MLVVYIMTEKIKFFRFFSKCPLCRLSKKVKEKNVVCLGIFTHYFLYNCGISLSLFVQLCARACLWSAVSESPNAFGWQISVHHRGNLLLQFTPCLQLHFLSFSCCFPSHLLMQLICLGTWQAQDWAALSSSEISGYWETVTLVSSRV